jgi:uncharacterized membrane protein
LTTAVLTGAYWLHMAATVVWMGGLFYQAVLLYPILADSNWKAETMTLVERLRSRFRPLVWLSLTVLVGTGLVQMTGNPNYEGLLAFRNRWSQAMLLKHTAVVGMVLIAGFQTWILQPRLTHDLLRRARKSDLPMDQAARTTRSLQRAIRLNLLAGILVLALTAVARTA